MNFVTVFDASNAAFPIGGLLPVFLLPCIGALLVFAPGLMQRLLPRGLQGKARRILSWCFFVFSSTIALFVSVTQYQAQHSIAKAIQDRDYSVVEGKVTNFVPMPFEGHALESFVVGGKRFTYSDYIATRGFRNTASHGGPIREGLTVRITHRGNLILRLEIAQ